MRKRAAAVDVSGTDGNSSYRGRTTLVNSLRGGYAAAGVDSPRRRYAAAVVLGLLSAACNTFDEPGVEGDSKIVIPTDQRPVTQALTSPPPISGGTLAISPDNERAVVSDPDRDRVSIVGLRAGLETVTHIALQRGDEPGRATIDTAGHAYVALRGSGDVLTLDLKAGTVLARTPVCAAPRGLAIESAQGVLHVACAEGRLVSMRLTDNTIERDLRIEGDLRDVMVTPNGLRVSTFKSSQLLTLDSTGNVLVRAEPDTFALAVNDENRAPTGDVDFDEFERSLPTRQMQPHIAWRTLQASDGSVLMLHQASAAEEVEIDKPARIENGAVASAYGGGASSFDVGCQGVVVTNLSRFGAQGPEMTVALRNAVVDVDLALSPDDAEIAIAQPGGSDAEAPRPRVVSAPDSGNPFTSLGGRSADTITAATPFTDGFPTSSIVMRVPLDLQHNLFRGGPPSSTAGTFAGCQFPGEVVPVAGQATAVAYLNTGELVVQSREPAVITIIPAVAKFGQPRAIALGGDSVRDTGHDLFHRDSGGGIACASCHAEGAEDGHTWNFKGQGLRRTQALHVGLAGTAPFHWAGDESDLGALMEDVFVGRMGGVHQSEPRVDALSRFLFALKAPTASRTLEEPAAARGKALFESAAVGCTNCHVGDKLTDNKSYDVGTSRGERLQVPSLRAVSYRAPFIHTGCAKTLQARFDPNCGGAKHGNTGSLTAPQIDDLVAYLQTL